MIEEKCVHHWIIETDSAVNLPKEEIKNKLVFGRNSVCKKCGEVKILRERYGLSWDSPPQDSG